MKKKLEKIEKNVEHAIPNILLAIISILIGYLFWGVVSFLFGLIIAAILNWLVFPITEHNSFGYFTCVSIAHILLFVNCYSLREVKKIENDIKLGKKNDYLGKGEIPKEQAGICKMTIYICIIVFLSINILYIWNSGIPSSWNINVVTMSPFMAILGAIAIYSSISIIIIIREKINTCIFKVTTKRMAKKFLGKRKY